MVKKKKESEISIDELSDLSGEGTVKQARYVVPVLKFNGNTGKFTLLIPDTTGNFVPEERGTEVEGVILKVRRTFTAFEKAPEGAVSYFTNEHNSWRDPLVLFERVKGAPRPRMIDQGSIQDLRAKYPDLRLRQNLYFLFENQIVKLGVRGKGLSSLFEYYRSFGPREHIFQFVTQVQCHQETSEGGLTYWVMDFIRGPESDIEDVAEKIREVAESLRLQDRSYQELPRMEEEAEEITKEKKEEEKEEIPVIEEETEKPLKEEEEIQVKDIPL